MLSPKILSRAPRGDTVNQSRLSTHFAIGGFTDWEEKGSRRFQIFDVVDVATGEVRRDGGHPVEVLEAEGLQGTRPLFAVRRLAETKEVRTPPPARFALLQPPLGSAHESWSSNDSFAHGPEVLDALAVPDAPHSQKS